MVHILRGQICGQRADVCTACCGQSEGVEGADRTWVFRVAGNTIWVGRNRIEDIWIDVSGTRAGSRNSARPRGVAIVNIRRRYLLLVVVQTVTAAPNYLALEISWAPVEADLRPEVKLLSVPSVDSCANGNSC